MKKTIAVALIIVLVLVLVFVSFVIIALTAGKGGTIPRFGYKVGLVRIEGVIFSGSGQGGLFGDQGAASERVIRALERARKDNSIKSLVIRINSPGGSAAASQEIYNEILRVRRSGKKVTVSMGDVAASGGYYVSAAADRIYANPATITGSIGVVMEIADLHVLLNRLGIELGSIKSGKHKDMGSISRPLTPEERKILQGLINDVFEQFVRDVHKGRKLPLEKVRELADGRIFTGSQAKALKLVDELGGLEDALKAAARDAGIKGEFEVKEYYEQRGLLGQLISEAESSFTSQSRAKFLMGLARRLLRVDNFNSLSHPDY
ncbi:MAG: signal peptide peptidase SppA [Armatimonadetes bacterium]|nr:signal peptide peptidase SppA [Armatimonadota bacterium]